MYHMRTLHTEIKFPPWNFDRKSCHGLFLYIIQCSHWHIAPKENWEQLTGEIVSKSALWTRRMDLQSSFWFLFLDCDRQSFQVVVPSHTHHAQHRKVLHSILFYFFAGDTFLIRRQITKFEYEFAENMLAHHSHFFGTLSSRLQYHRIRIRFIIAKI